MKPISSAVFNNKDVSVFVPDDKPFDRALARITHLGIGAHQDDLEIMAFHGISKCYKNPDLWFGGVTCTDGTGSPLGGTYANYTTQQLKDLRKREQEEAAVVGDYGFMVQLGYESKTVKRGSKNFLKDLQVLITSTNPSVVYTHSLADKHPTHVAVSISVLKAIRKIPAPKRPGLLLGCEVWRDLDWMCDSSKVALDVSRNEKLAKDLLSVFKSQIGSGKRYDIATLGRRSVNATFYQPDTIGSSKQITFAMDLTPLIQDDTLDISKFIINHVDDFKNELLAEIKRFLDN